MTRVAVACVAVHLMPGGTPLAWGQLVQGPQGTVRGIFGGTGPASADRTTTEWTAVSDLSAGRDREPLETPEGPGALRSGRLALTGAASTRYWRGRTRSFFEAEGGGYISRQSLSTQDLRSVQAGTRFAKALGARNQILGGIHVNLEPVEIQDLLNALDPAPVNAPVNAAVATIPSDVSPLGGVREQRLITTTASAGASRNWTPRQRLEGTFAVVQGHPVRGAGLDSRSEDVSLSEWWNMTDRTSLFGVYRFTRSYLSEQEASGRRGRVHAPQLGWRSERAVAPGRSIIFEARGGVAHVSSFPSASAPALFSVEPIGSAEIQASLSQNWVVLVSGGREVSALNGLTTEPFVTDQAQVQLGATIARRLRLGVAGAYSRGAAASGGTNSFDGTTAEARAQYGIAHWCGVFGSYSYYEHRVSEAPIALPTLPVAYERHLWRVGLTLWLPVYGSF